MTTIREDFIKGKVIKLPTLEVEWCHTSKPDTKFGKSQWEITVRLPPNLAAEMKEVGFNVKKKSEAKNYKAGDPDYDFIVAYRKTVTAKGVALEPPKIFERDGKSLFEGLIGNGTTMNIKVSAKYVEVSGENKLPCRLVSGQIVDLVPYGDAGFEPLDDDAAAYNDDNGGNSF